MLLTPIANLFRNISNVSDPTKIMKRKSFRFALLILIIILFFQYSCLMKGYVGKYFCYPPGSKFHEDNWEYLGDVRVTSAKSGSFTQKSRKTFRITVIDRKGNNYLKDIMKFDCGDTDISATWDTFDVLHISLSEVGNKYAEDDYNKRLVKEGPRKLTDLEYRFDHSLNKFVRKSRNP